MSTLSQLVAWVMAGFYALVHSYAFAIIAIGVTFMVLIIPFTLKSTRSMLAMQKLQPQMKQLQQQHKDDKLALQQAISELYKKEGVNPLGGCLPALAPFPLLYVLYHVISGLSNVKKVTGGYIADPLYLNTKTRMYHDLIASAPHHAVATKAAAAAQIHSLGLNLATSAWDAIEQHLGFGAILGSLLLIVVNIAANFYQQVQISNLNPMVRQNQQMSQQMRFMRYFPIILGVIWIRLGSGLVLYYCISAIFRVVQQWMMYHYDPRVKALVAKDDHDIEVLDAKLRELEQKQPRPAPANGASPAPRKRNTPPRPFVEPGPPKAPVTKANRGNGKAAAAPPPAPRYTNAASASSRSRNRKRKGR
jgi:YidC/Oxa1 family membrane protein insertase